MAADKSALLGSTTPRLWTRPLVEGPPGPCGCGCALTPETSLGFAFIRFAEEVLPFMVEDAASDPIVLDEWQRWLSIHALELKPDGAFRFRRILLLVARQNGKTTLMQVLTLWLLWTGRVRLAVGTAQDLDIARECWNAAAERAMDTPDLAADLVGKPRRANGQEELRFLNGCRYKIKATTEDAGRGIPGVGLLLADELRTHRDYKAWSALSKTTMARPNALIIGMSNAGSDESIVLNDLREKALAGRSKTLGIFEWSAPDGCRLDDRAAWAQANPSLGYGRLTVEAIEDALSDPPEVFRTEVLCQRVEALDGAIDLSAWRHGEDAVPIPAELLGKVMACVDVAPDGEHVALLAGVAEGDRVRVEVVDAWASTQEAAEALPEVLALIRPVATGWFPAGPGAELATVLREAPNSVEFKGSDVVEICMEFAGLVKAGQILHPGDPLLDAHVIGARRYNQGDGWRFVRRGAGHVNAAYAAAGVARLVRTIPPDTYDPLANIG